MTVSLSFSLTVRSIDNKLIANKKQKKTKHGCTHSELLLVEVNLMKNTYEGTYFGKNKSSSTS